MPPQGKRSYTRIAFLLVKWLWILYCALLLFQILAALDLSDPIMRFHLAEVLHLNMVVLAFPFGLGFLLAASLPEPLLSSLAPDVPFQPAAPYWWFVGVWLLYFIGGYLQWFVLVPPLVRKPRGQAQA